LHIGFLHIGFWLEGVERGKISAFWISAFDYVGFLFYGQNISKISAFWRISFLIVGFLTSFFCHIGFLIYRLFDRRLFPIGFLPVTLMSNDSFAVVVVFFPCSILTMATRWRCISSFSSPCNTVIGQSHNLATCTTFAQSRNLALQVEIPREEWTFSRSFYDFNVFAAKLLADLFFIPVTSICLEANQAFQDEKETFVCKGHLPCQV
jgi:hypothetical protein